MAKRPHRQPKGEYKGDTPLPDPKHELFCELFTTNTLPHFWGHGQNCYAFAYGYTKKIDEAKALLVGPAKSRKGKSKPLVELEIKRMEAVCKQSASRLLTYVYIKRRCDHLLDNLASHLIVDRELLYTIQQRRDLSSKVRAIEHHDKREQRIREKIDIKHEFEPVKTIYMH